MLIAGEASGDLHASELIKAIRKEDERAEFRFFGGDKMADASRVSPDVHYRELNVMGFSEVLRKLPRLWGNLRIAKRVLREYRPDVLILVDFPGFNLKLAAYAYKLGIRVDWYISPKVWAWKAWRVKKIKKYVKNLYSILPFEESFYQRYGYRTQYVGNPSVQEIDYALGHLPPLKHFLQRQGLEGDDRRIIALLPGSRRGEIRNNLPLMIEAAKRFPEFRYVVGAAPSMPEKFYREVAQDPGLSVVFGCTTTLLKHSVAALVTSGTATLETALVGTPQVVCYRANGMKISYKIMEKLLNVRYVSLPNLIVQNDVVPELLVHLCTVDSIARELSPLLQPSPRREWQINGYKNMRRRLGTYVASEYAAELIVDSLRREKGGNDETQEQRRRYRPCRRIPRQGERSEGNNLPRQRDRHNQNGDEKPRQRRREPRNEQQPRRRDNGDNDNRQQRPRQNNRGGDNNNRRNRNRGNKNQME